MAASGRDRVDVALRTCCLILCLVAGSRQMSITDFLVPEAVEVGNDVELHCRYDLDVNDSENNLFVKWWWTPDPTTGQDKKQIYQRSASHKSSTAHVEVKENDTILLKKMQPMHSGIYECEVDERVGTEARKHGELIVFTKGTGPRLNISSVEDGDDEDNDEDVLIECEAEQVAPLPDLAISIDGENINVTEIVTVANDGFYGVYANVTLSKKDINEGAEVRCELFYANSTIAHPQFEATMEFNSGAALPTTETPEHPTEAEATPASIQNSRDNGSRLHGSWVLLFVVTLLTKLTVH